jgi:hypothetical protein
MKKDLNKLFAPIEAKEINLNDVNDFIHAQLENIKERDSLEKEWDNFESEVTRVKSNEKKRAEFIVKQFDVNPAVAKRIAAELWYGDPNDSAQWHEVVDILGDISQHKLFEIALEEAKGNYDLASNIYKYGTGQYKWFGKYFWTNYWIHMTGLITGILLFSASAIYLVLGIFTNISQEDTPLWLRIIFLSLALYLIYELIDEHRQFKEFYAYTKGIKT